jgi:hypothetical protein
MKRQLTSIIGAFMVWLTYGGGIDGTGAQATTIRVGKQPISIRVNDLNGDHIPDLVVANGGDSSVTILLGKGKGAFREPPGSPFYAGCQPNDIAITDLNKDGVPDLVFANHTKKYLTALVGDGRGGFKQMQGSPFTVNSVPHTHGVVAGDFNHDGNIDLLTDSWGNDHIALLLGNSRHGFDSPGTLIQVGKHPYQRLRTADINGDGNLDIITTNLDGNNVTVLLGDGKGGFKEVRGSPFAAGDSPFGVAIGDVNGDGKLDLAIVNSPTITSSNTGRDGLTILLGDGKGDFQMMMGSPFRTGASPVQVAIGDINSDGINDVVTTNYKSASISIFLMGKQGVVSQYSVKVGNQPEGVAVADVNGDGKNEILVTNNGDNTISIIKPGK